MTGENRRVLVEEPVTMPLSKPQNKNHAVAYSCEPWHGYGKLKLICFTN